MMGNTCKHCGGSKDVRNPTGECDHLMWPDYLTEEAKRANGYVPMTATIWVQKDVEPGGIETVSDL